MYDFFSERHLSSRALIVSYFAETEMLFSNMCMHSTAFVPARFIYFKKLFSYSENSPTLFSGFVFVNVAGYLDRKVCVNGTEG